MIHEGTNGIQSLDLLGRKAKVGMPILVQRIKQDISRARRSDDKDVQAHAQALYNALLRLDETTMTLVGTAGPNPKIALANSHEYLNMAGHTVIAWMWLRQELAAIEAASIQQVSKEFSEGKRFASRYFFRHELPKTIAQSQLLRTLDTTVLEMQASFF